MSFLKVLVAGKGKSLRKSLAFLLFGSLSRPKRTLLKEAIFSNL